MYIFCLVDLPHTALGHIYPMGSRSVSWDVKGLDSETGHSCTFSAVFKNILHHIRHENTFCHCVLSKTNITVRHSTSDMLTIPRLMKRFMEPQPVTPPCLQKTANPTYTIVPWCFMKHRNRFLGGGAVYLILQIITGWNTRISVGIGPPDKIH